MDEVATPARVDDQPTAADRIDRLIDEFRRNIRKSKDLAGDTEAFCDQLLEILADDGEDGETDLQLELGRAIDFILLRPDAELRKRLIELQEYVQRNRYLSADGFAMYAHI